MDICNNTVTATDNSIAITLDNKWISAIILLLLLIIALLLLLLLWMSLVTGLFFLALLLNQQ
jgi:hypothetical protein